MPQGNLYLEVHKPTILMKLKIILTIYLVTAIALPSFAQKVLPSDDSLRSLYAQYQSYSPSSAELKDYNLIKYHIAWLLLDELLIAKNIEAMQQAEPSGSDYNLALVIPFDEIPFEKSVKIIPLADKLIRSNAKDKSIVRPLLLSKIFLLEKQENYASLKVSLPEAFNIFKGSDRVINRLKQAELPVLYNTGEEQKAIALGAAYYRESASIELLKLHISHLYRSKAYPEIIGLAEAIKKANLMDCFFILATAYLQTNDSKNAEKLFDLIYRNIERPVAEEIRLAKLQLDSNALILPEAILAYTEQGGNQVFSILAPQQLETIATYYYDQKQQAKACDFYQYTLLNINAVIKQKDWTERYGESNARFSKSLSDYKKGEEQLHAELKKLKAEIVKKHQEASLCTFQIL